MYICVCIVTLYEPVRVMKTNCFSLFIMELHQQLLPLGSEESARKPANFFHKLVKKKEPNNFCFGSSKIANKQHFAFLS